MTPDVQPHGATICQRRSLIWDAAQQASFRATYGGEGTSAWYGQMVDASLQVTAVNGDLNLPVTAAPVAIQYLTAVTRQTPLAVPGTATSQCVYLVVEVVPLAGQPAEQLMSDLVSKRPVNGTIICVRRSADRNLSVQLMLAAATDAAATPAQIAANVAAETDRVWQSLD